MKHKSRLLCATGILAATVIAVAAQNPALPPIIRDIPEQATLPKDGAFDILGLRLGATKDEIIARLRQIAPSAKPHVARLPVTENDGSGNFVEFAYDRGLETSFRPPDSTQEHFEAVFTTRVNGERALRISRRVTYPQNQQASVTSLLSDLKSKYGPISYESPGSGIKDIYFIWFNGKRVPVMTEKEVNANRYRRGTPAACIGTKAESYSFMPKRAENAPGCTTQIHVQIFPGARPDLSTSVHFHLMDRARLMQNTADTDAWILKELERVRGSQKGTRSKL